MEIKRTLSNMLLSTWAWNFGTTDKSACHRNVMKSTFGVTKWEGESN